MRRAAVFLDRDGTLNHDPGYLGAAEEFRFLPGAVPAVKRLKDAGYLVFVVSNQSGIARGFFDEKMLRRIHDRMEEELRRGGAVLDGIYYCPHHPDARCPCRKPKPRMVLEAARKYGVDLRRSYFVGDRASDIETGRNAGCRTVLVMTGAGAESLKELRGGRRADHVAADLPAAAEWILSAGGGEEARRGGGGRGGRAER